MQTYFTEGIILKHQNFREADRIITVYTKEHGKLEFISRGSRKIKSKLAGSLEPFFYTKMQIVKGKKIDVIASSEIINNYKSLINNLEKIALTSFLIEILDNLTRINQKDERTYSLLMEVLGIINESVDIKRIRSKITWFFIWRFLSFSGFKPELYKCLKCKKDTDQGFYYFDYGSGGIICSNCQSKVKNKISVSNYLINIIKLIYKKEFNDLFGLKLDNKTSQLLSKITFLYLKYHLEKDLKSERFLKVFKDN